MIGRNNSVAFHDKICLHVQFNLKVDSLAWLGAALKSPLSINFVTEYQAL